MLAWHYTRSGRLRKLLVEMAHWRVQHVHEPLQRDPLPNAQKLAGWAVFLKEARTDEEDDSSYAKRVFQVSDVASE